MDWKTNQIIIINKLLLYDWWLDKSYFVLQKLEKKVMNSTVTKFKNN